MNLIAEKPMSAQVSDNPVRVAFMAYKKRTNKSWSVLAGETKVAMGSLSNWGNGTYAAETDNITPKIAEFLKLKTEAADDFKTRFAEPKNIELKATTHIHAALRSAQLDGAMVAVFGNPGVSKTASIRMYAAENANVWIVTASPSLSGLKVMLLEIARAMGRMVDRGAAATLSRIIRDYVSTAANPLLIIDEASNLTEQTVEEIRAIHDATDLGVAFIGNYETLVKIEGSSRSASHAQRFSRISMRLDLDAAHQEDIETILDAWGIENAAQRKILRAIASVNGGGALRTLTKTIKLAKRMSAFANQELSTDAIQAAYSQLGGRNLGTR